MEARHGTREVTEEDRRRAVLLDLMNSESPVTFTPGMRRHLASLRKRTWRQVLIDRMWRREGKGRSSGDG